tara:strand:+ start:1640 stop:2560 length:921 start_codon:yes stop_codon:yes gene_type:complete
MGTPDFAMHILKGLIQNKFNVVAVITAPDRPAGRGQNIKQSPVKTYSINEKLKLFQPKNLKDPVFIKDLKNLNIDLQIVVAFRMLPKIVWEIPLMGTINLHASLLPQYRGAAPINWAIINGETETGVTTFFIDEKIDTGDIIMQLKTKILIDDTAGTLHNKLMSSGLKLVIKTILKINENNIRIVQNENNKLNKAPKLNKENCKIDWRKNPKQIIDFIRGLNPLPGAWTVIKNGDDQINIKIFKVKFEKTHQTNAVGTIFSNKSSIKISVSGGFIHLIEFKFPGKKQMDVKSFLNGYTFDKNSKII